MTHEIRFEKFNPEKLFRGAERKYRSLPIIMQQGPDRVAHTCVAMCDKCWRARLLTEAEHEFYSKSLSFASYYASYWLFRIAHAALFNSDMRVKKVEVKGI